MINLLRFELAQLFRSWQIYIMAAALSIVFYLFLDISVESYPSGKTLNSYLGVFDIFFINEAIINLFIIFITASLFLKEKELGFEHISISLPTKNIHILLSKFFSIFLQTSILFFLSLLTFYIYTQFFISDDVRLQSHQSSVYWLFSIVIFLPNVLFSIALTLALASKFKNKLVTIIVCILSLQLYDGLLLLGVHYDLTTLTALLDYSGYYNILQQTEFLTEYEKDSINPYINSGLWINRVFISLFSIILLSYAIYRIRQPEVLKNNSINEQSQDTTTLDLTISIQFNGIMNWLQQLQSQIQLDLSVIVLKKWFWFSLSGVITLLFVLSSDLSGPFNSTILPSSEALFSHIANTISGILILLACVFSSQLFNIEKSNKLYFLVSSTPIFNSVFLLSKWLSSAIICLIICLAGLITAIVTQLLAGLWQINWSLYLFGFLVYLPIYAILICSINLFFQSIVKHALISLALTGLSVYLWVKFVNFAPLMAAPGIQYSVFTGWQANFIGWLSYNSMWLALGISLLLLGALLIKLPTLKITAIKTIKQPKQYWLTLILLITVFSGLLINNYSQQINHGYSFDKDQVKQLQAEYEKKYLYTLDLPAPEIKSMTGTIDLFAKQRKIKVAATLTLMNIHSTSLSTLYLFWGPDNKNTTFTIINSDIGFTFDSQFDVHILTLPSPLASGESIELSYQLEYQAASGLFKDYDLRLQAASSFIDNSYYIPLFKVNEQIFLSTDKDRAEYDLKEHTISVNQEQVDKNQGLLSDSSDMQFDLILSTDLQQQATMPAELINQWQSEDRQYFHYKTAKATDNFSSLLSGQYQIKNAQWQGLDLQVQYLKSHEKNVPTIMQAMRQALNYYQINFSDYQHNFMRIIETPAYFGFAQSFAGTFPFSSSLGFNSDTDDKQALNLPYFVTAHEVAHQWWGHQLKPAKGLGAQFLSESLSQYSAYQVVKKHLDRKQRLILLKEAQQSYLSSAQKLSMFNNFEPNLLNVAIDDQHVFYQKGLVSMAQIAYMLGEDRVNSALKALLQQHASEENRFASAEDFLQQLLVVTPADYKKIVREQLSDLLRFDNQILDYQVQEIANGQYQISATVKSHSVTYNASTQREYDSLLNYPIEIGLFKEHPEKSQLSWQDNQIAISHVNMQKGAAIDAEYISENVAKLQWLVDEKPSWVVIDPEYLYLDRNLKNNARKID